MNFSSENIGNENSSSTFLSIELSKKPKLLLRGHLSHQIPTKKHPIRFLRVSKRGRLLTSLVGGGGWGDYSPVWLAEEEEEITHQFG